MEEEGVGCVEERRGSMGMGSLEERRGSMSHYRRRTSNHNLTLDVNLARARGAGGEECRVCTPPPPGPTLQQVQQEGKLVFNNFVREDMQTHGLLDHLDLVTPGDSPTSTGPKNPVWAKAGRELREMADAFSRTKERQRLRERAYGCTVLGFLSELADWAAMLFWVSKVTVRFSHQVAETSTSNLPQSAFTTDYNNNSTI